MQKWDAHEATHQTTVQAGADVMDASAIPVGAKRGVIRDVGALVKSAGVTVVIPTHACANVRVHVVGVDVTDVS